MKRKTDIFLTEKLDAHFREKWEGTLIAKGKAIGKAEEKTATSRELILEILRGKFGKVPKHIERAINQMNDPIALKSLAVRTANCKTLAEFSEEF